MTPRTDACIAQYRSGSLDFCWTLTEMARNLEVELAEAEAAAKRWYEAASPYATPTALQEALALAHEEIAELRGYLTGSNGAFLALRKDAARYRWLCNRASPEYSV